MKTLENFRKEISEGVISTSDYKIGKDGRKYKAHRFSLNKDIDANDNNIMLTQTNEAIQFDLPKDPPFVLILKREGIRYYPNNTKVALYYNAKLDKHFTIPYGHDINATSIQAEEINSDINKLLSIDESVMDTLHQIHNEKQARRVKFADGSTKKIDGYTASAIVGLHNVLSDDNKQKLRDMVHKSPSHLAKAAELAFKHVK